MGFWQDVLGIPGGVMDTAHAIDEVGSALVGFFELITDKFMWRSLGWLVLGAALLITGIVLWTKKAGYDVLPSVVPLPV